MTRIAVVAARAGSKGVREKNIRRFAGRPLLGHSVAQARASGAFDLIVFTSDSERYRDVAREAGADLVVDRPDHLSSDTAAKLPVLTHALHAAEGEMGRPVEVLVDLQPTSPLRRPWDIAAAIALLDRHEAAWNVVSTTQAKHSPDYTMLTVASDGFARLGTDGPGEPRRRQDAEVYQAMNGSIYVWRRAGLLASRRAVTARTIIYEMPEECQFDIDSELDLAIAEFVYELRFAALWGG